MSHIIDYFFKLIQDIFSNFALDIVYKGLKLLKVFVKQSFEFCSREENADFGLNFLLI